MVLRDILMRAAYLGRGATYRAIGFAGTGYLVGIAAELTSGAGRIAWTRASATGIIRQAGYPTQRRKRVWGAHNMELSEGYAVGPYRLVGRAGSGGMAEVWRAYDARLKRYVAIKFLSPRYATDQTYLERFRHEAQAISRLDHPNILMVHDYGEQEGWTYMVSPYVGGGTLAAQLRRGPWTVEEALAVLEPLAAALDHAHSEGIVHRDVKPSNVLFTERGRLVLSDFGIARMIEGTTLLSQAGLVVGTPMYMSPEQADAQRVTGASDLYSLGVIAYEMLTGRPPFMAETPLALLRAHIDKPLPPPRTVNPSLSEPIEAALFTIMAKNPANRFPSGQEFVEALRASASRPAPAPVPAPVPTPPAPLTDPTLPLDTSDVHLDDAEPVSGPVGADRGLRRSTAMPTAPTLPLDATVPLSEVERSGVVARWLGPLATMAAAWACAWALLLTMRMLRYTPIYEAVGSWPTSEASPWLSARFGIAAAVGLIGAAGIVIGLLWTGRSFDRRSALLLLGGWALSYGVVHAVLYLFARAYGFASIAGLDHYLSFLSGQSPLPLLRLAHLVDVVPASIGASVTAYLLRGKAPGSAVWIILGWTLAAGLGLLSTMLISSAAEQSLFGELLSGPRRFGIVAGLFAGLIQGIVGGWLTLRALRPGHRSRALPHC
jgi:serine/threonine protein kinase